MLQLEDLHVALEDGTEIVKGVDLAVDLNEVHAIMGPNGSGKSTLSYAIAGHPAYTVTKGRVLLDGADITEAGADERAQRGLFLAFQYPQAIPGVRVTEFLRSAINAIRKAKAGGDDPVPVKEFRDELFTQMDRLKVSRELASRYLNDGFSGGEKKRVEILQMAMLKPRMAVLDETDSGLDIDALKVVAGGIRELVGPNMGALVITHYQRILNYIKPDHVHVFVDGKIVASGGPELADKLEEYGYEEWGAEQRGRSRPERERRGRLMAQIENRERDRPRDRHRLRREVRLPRLGHPRGLLLQVRSRALARARRDDRRAQVGARLDAQVPSQLARLLPARPLPSWGGDVSGIDFENIYYYIQPTEKQADSWEELPADIRDTWDKLGIPEAEKKYLAGVGAQYESEVVYHKLQEDLAKQGVLFLDMDSGLREHEELVKQYFGTIIPQNDNKFAALNTRRLVGRVVHLRSARRQDRAAAAGLLPDQRREHGPVRADDDHRRRGRLRPLRRGLHGADLLERLAALAPSSRSWSRRAGAAATRRSRTGRTTSTTSSPSGRSPTRTRRWSGSTGTSARS